MNRRCKPKVRCLPASRFVHDLRQAARFLGRLSSLSHLLELSTTRNVDFSGTENGTGFSGRCFVFLQSPRPFSATHYTPVIFALLLAKHAYGSRVPWR